LKHQNGWSINQLNYSLQDGIERKHLRSFFGPIPKRKIFPFLKASIIIAQEVDRGSRSGLLIIKTSLREMTKAVAIIRIEIG